MTRPLTLFFFLAFAVTWAVWVPRAIDPDGFGGIVGQVWSYGPALSAVLVAALTGGLGDLGRRLIRWRVAPQWYAVALLGPATVFLAISSVNVALGGHWAVTVRPPVSLLSFFLLLAFTDGLGEETGWRGFALPRMLARMSNVTASLILGLVWATWHLPLFWTETAPLYDQLIPMLFIKLPAQAIIYTWLFQRTRGSALLAILMHASANTFGLRTSDLRLSVIEAIVTWALALTAVLVGGSQLSRASAADKESIYPTSGP